MKKYEKLCLLSVIGGSLVITNDLLPPYRKTWALTEETANELERKKRAGSLASIVSYLLRDNELAIDDSYIVDENTQLNVSALNGIFANDNNSQPFSLTLVDDVTSGMLNLQPDGSFTYLPGPNFVGIDSFRYSLTTMNGQSDDALVTIRVNGLPDAMDDNFSTPMNMILTGNVIGNDTVVDGADIDAVVNAVTGNGAITLNEDGSFVYTPNINFVGTDTFIYTLRDTDDDTDTATISINVGLPEIISPDRSIAENESFTDGAFTVVASAGLATTGTALAVTVDGTITNLTLAQLNNLSTANVVLNNSSSIGGDFTLTNFNASTGVVTYAFDPEGNSQNHPGGATSVDNSELLTIVATDTNANSNTAEILIISVTDTEPTANNDQRFMSEGTTAIAGNVVGIAGSAMGDVQDTIIDTNANPVIDLDFGSTDGTVGTGLAGDFGSLVISSDGVYTYTLDNTNTVVQGLKNGESETDVFTYTIEDGDGDTDTASITVTINGVENPPTINVTASSVIEESVSVGDVVATFASNDLDGDSLTHSVLNDPNGYFSISGTDVVLTQAGVDAINDDNLNLSSLTVEIQADDGTFQSSDSDTLGITRVNDSAPTINVTAASVTEESVSVGDVVAIFASNDLDGDSLTHSVLNDPNGYFSISGTDVVLTQAGVDAINDDNLNLSSLTVEIQADDGTFQSSDADTLSITRVNDNAPTINVTGSSVTEESVSVGDVVATFASNDLDGDSLTHSVLNDPNGYFSISGTDVVLTQAGVDAINDDNLNLSSLTIETQADDGTFQSSDSDAVSITRVDDPAPVVTIPDTNGGGVVGDESVAENATLTASFTVSANAGLAASGTAFALTVDGSTTNLTLAQLNALGSTPVAITDGNDGDITLTGFDVGTGVVSYTFDPTLTSRDHSGGDTSVLENFTLVVTDNEGDTDSENLDILITDTDPVANNDARSINEGSSAIAGNAVGIAGAATGDVQDIITDTNASPVTDIDFDATDGTVGTNLAGDLGSLIISSTGVYTYTLDNANPAVQGLKGGESDTDVFTYTITDGEGDTDTASITITVNGVEDAPPAITIPDNNGSGVVGDSSVAENSVILSGQFTLTAAAGIASATVDGQDITNASVSTVNITGNNGALVVNNFNSGTGVASFTYDPTGFNRDHSAGDLSITDQFTVALTDNENESISDTLDILITDTAPTAAPDTASITENFAPNPITGDVTTNDTSGADTAISVSGIDFGGAQTVGTPFSSSFGTLDLNSDGTYTYTLDNGNLVINDLDDGESVAETFSYTITDTDGDTSTTTLTITVNGTTD